MVFAHPAVTQCLGLGSSCVAYAVEKGMCARAHTHRMNRDGEREEDADCKVVQLQARVSE